MLFEAWNSWFRIYQVNPKRKKDAKHRAYIQYRTKTVMQVSLLLVYRAHHHSCDIRPSVR